MTDLDKNPFSDFDKKMMEQALSLAKIAYDKGEIPVGAVITHNNKIIAESHNYKEEKKNPLAHAEILAIQKAAKELQRWRLNDCHIYVTLEPCPMCAGAIVNARISRLIYATFDAKSGAAGSLMNLCQDHRLNHRLTVESNLLANKSSSLLKKFFSSLRSKKLTAAQ